MGINSTKGFLGLGGQSPIDPNINPDPPQEERPFFLLQNGVTVVLKGSFSAGATGLVDDDTSGKVYTAYDQTMWDAVTFINFDPLVDFTSVCTTLVNNMSFAFIASGSFNQDITHFDTSNVTNMSGMLTTLSFNQPIGNWDVSNVTSMSQMLTGATSFNQPLNDWDVSSVTDMNRLFDNTLFNQPLDNWDVSNVTDMTRLFDNTPFNQDISSWNVSNVTDMREMFSNSNFNQDISNWNVSSVTDMVAMFLDNNVFNQDLTSWCVELIPSEPTNFATGSALTAPNKPLWGDPC